MKLSLFRTVFVTIPVRSLWQVFIFSNYLHRFFIVVDVCVTVLVFVFVYFPLAVKIKQSISKR